MAKLAPKDDELLTETADAVFAGVNDSGSIAHLSTARQVFVRIYTGQAIIDNGGLPYFFSSNFPDAPDYSLFSDAYRAIGAADVAGCIDAAVALFPFSKPHLNLQRRKEYIQEHCSGWQGEMCELGDRIIAESDRVFTLLAHYVRQHPKDFAVT